MSHLDFYLLRLGPGTPMSALPVNIARVSMVLKRHHASLLVMDWSQDPDDHAHVYTLSAHHPAICAWQECRCWFVGCWCVYIGSLPLFGGKIRRVFLSNQRQTGLEGFSKPPSTAGGCKGAFSSELMPGGMSRVATPLCRFRRCDIWHAGCRAAGCRVSADGG